MDQKKFEELIEGLEQKATEVAEKLESLESPTEEEVKALSDERDEIKSKLDELMADKAEMERKAETEALQDEVKSLRESFEAARKIKTFDFNPALPSNGGGDDDAEYGKHGKRSYFSDVKAAKGGDSRAWERLEAIKEEYSEDQKAMVEHTDSQGGFLVPPEIADELIRLRDVNGVLRGIIPSHAISTDELRIGAIDNGLAVAWTAELTEKIQSEFSFSELSANVFTAAGLAVASNQLLADSRFSLDQMINSDLAKRFIALEEQAFLNGSGVGQPLGIRNTAGVQPFNVETGATATTIVDAIVNAVTAIYSTYFGAPTGIVMHPRTWGFLVKARESGTPGSYILGPPSTIYGRNVQDSLPGYGNGPLPRGELFGIPVYTTPNVPTTLGGGTESCIFVGNWGEALILDRQGVTTDQSEHVFFTSNQTVFRSEERLGFTAARYPQAFAVIEGAGLAGI
jgi:HK97 family phage major capsid protein